MRIRFSPKQWYNTVQFEVDGPAYHFSFRYDRECWYFEICGMWGKHNFYAEKAFQPYCPLCGGSGGFHGSEIEPPDPCGYCYKGHVTPLQWFWVRYRWKLWLFEHTHTDCLSCKGSGSIKFNNAYLKCLNCDAGFLPFWRGGWRGMKY